MEKQKRTPKLKLIIGGLAFIGILLILLGMFMNLRTPAEAPAGEAPEGKVWSPEHEHWHDAE